jgi:S1-C subfamily serine protease
MATQSILNTFSSELADLVERASSFVVAVDGGYRRPGSGLIFAPDLVITADHLLEREDHVTVRVGTRRFAAEVAGREPGANLAVLRVAGLGGSEPERSNQVRTGQLVVSVSRTPTAAEPAAGIDVIAARGGPLRTGRGLILREVFRTAAATYPGASGAAILDTSGRVIGVSTSGLLRGLPVVIPSAQLWEIAAGLGSGTTPKRAYLGVSVLPVQLPAAAGESQRGLLVSGLASEAAAQAGGVLVGDVIVSVDGQPLQHPDDLQDRLAALSAGATVTLGLVRGGHPQQLGVVTGSR